MVTETHVDVLIIGAGPAGEFLSPKVCAHVSSKCGSLTGLMCANGLAKAGVNVKVVDKRCAYSVLLIRKVNSRPGQTRSLQDKPMGSSQGLWRFFRSVPGIMPVRTVLTLCVTRVTASLTSFSVKQISFILLCASSLLSL